MKNVSRSIVSIVLNCEENSSTNRSDQQTRIFFLRRKSSKNNELNPMMRFRLTQPFAEKNGALIVERIVTDVQIFQILMVLFVSTFTIEKTKISPMKLFFFTSNLLSKSWRSFATSWFPGEKRISSDLFFRETKTNRKYPKIEVEDNKKQRRRSSQHLSLRVCYSLNSKSENSAKNKIFLQFNEHNLRRKRFQSWFDKCATFPRIQYHFPIDLTKRPMCFAEIERQNSLFVCWFVFLRIKRTIRATAKAAQPRGPKP